MFELTLDIKRGPKQKAATFKKALKLAMRDGMKFWQQNILKKHFKAGANSRYKYARRSQKYIERKRKKHGVAIPLVNSGKARDWFTQPSHFYVTGTQKKMAGKFATPNSLRYFWMTPAGHPNKPKEMKSMHQSENNKIASFIKARTMEYVAQLEKQRG